MSLNSFGHLFRVTTWGESHGPALGATVDGTPPGIERDAPARASTAMKPAASPTPSAEPERASGVPVLAGWGL